MLGRGCYLGGLLLARGGLLREGVARGGLLGGGLLGAARGLLGDGVASGLGFLGKGSNF